MIMREELLSWYDANRRELPWRYDNPNPYHVLLSEIMLQQTTVTAVKPYYKNFLEKWPSVHDLARAHDEEVMAEWAGLGYYSRARNLLKAVREIDRLGAFPHDEAKLRKLSGVGEYTAAAIASIAFGAEVLPIDGNIKRVLARYHAIDDPINKPSVAIKNAAKEWEGPRAGDLAQAFMDLGSQVCRPKNPNCEACPLRIGCSAKVHGRVDELPKRAPKPIKKEWVGNAYIIETPQGIAFAMRPKGLLGEMYGLPSQMGEAAAFEPPMQGEWQNMGMISHVFTHINLALTLWYISLENLPLSNVYTFLDDTQQKGTASLWKKALKHAKDQRNGES